jgi:hypothetical protein
MKTFLFTWIKRLSSILIPGAVGLEGWALYARLAHLPLPGFLTPMLWLGGFALSAHLIEGGIAAGVAARQQKGPLRWGAYTFLVGTVGLLELFESLAAQPKSAQIPESPDGWA